MKFHLLKKILFVAIVCWSSLVAQAGQAQRWLFVFDTSSAMKKRLPQTLAEIKNLFLVDLDGKLQDGASIGVWTFNSKLRMGDFPLTEWQPGDAQETVSNLLVFIRKQSFSGSTSFGVLQPTLGDVIQSSERLTVVIFCDGDDEIHWTPYDDGLNSTLRQTRDARKKDRQPYVIMLRTQQGKYVGATVNFPPLAASIPPFPLLPREIRAMETNQPAPVAPVSRPAAVAPPLIIVGTTVGTNAQQVLAEASNSISASVEKTNVASTQNVGKITNAALSPIAKTNSTESSTNNLAAEKIAQDNATRILIFVGAGLFVLALVMVVLLFTRHPRGPSGSLITSSMQDLPGKSDKK